MIKYTYDLSNETSNCAICLRENSILCMGGQCKLCDCLRCYDCQYGPEGFRDFTGRSGFKPAPCACVRSGL